MEKDVNFFIIIIIIVLKRLKIKTFISEFPK